MPPAVLWNPDRSDIKFPFILNALSRLLSKYTYAFQRIVEWGRIPLRSRTHAFQAKKE